MSPSELVLGLVGTAFTVVVLMISGSYAQRRACALPRAWSDFARARGLAFSTRSLHGEIRGVRVTVDRVYVPSDDAIVVETRVVASAREPRSVDLRVCDRDFVRPPPREPEVELGSAFFGDAAFDARFALACDDGARARELLSRGVQRALHRFPVPFELRYARGYASLAWRTSDTDLAKLDPAIAALLAVCDAEAVVTSYR